jgi:2-dehydropantoate 2-reductase
MAVTGAYYDVPMGEVQKAGEIRNTFIGLSQESAALGAKLGIEFKEDLVEYNLKVIDKLDPKSTASMQKDIARGHESEVQGLLFDMLAAAEKNGIKAPTYEMVAQKFASKLKN